MRNILGFKTDGIRKILLYKNKENSTQSNKNPTDVLQILVSYINDEVVLSVLFKYHNSRLILQAEP